MKHLHAMGVVARRTGLSPHLIRIWERRYDAVTPSRTGTNRRLFSDSEVARLVLLRRATRKGHSIGRIAKLSEDGLRRLLRQETATNFAANGLNGPKGQGWFRKAQIQSDDVTEALACILTFDAQSLEGVLTRGATYQKQMALLQRLIVPLLKQIGDGWQCGRLTVAHEHFASAVIRKFLGTLPSSCTLPETAPRLVVTTPTGQWHELGAILVAVTAGYAGWHVSYLGPSLPAEEIARAVHQGSARAVALSLVYPEDDPHLEAEMKRLRRLLPVEVSVLAGGQAAPAYCQSLKSIGAIQLDNLLALQNCLSQLRKSPNPLAADSRSL